MPLSTAAKAALCICPTAVLAGTVATVPAAKRAVHHLTARPAPRPVRHLASAPARPAAAPVQQDCIPVAPGTVPAVPLVTYAAPIPDEPGSDTTTGVPGPAVGALAGGTPVAVGPIVSPTPGPDVVTTPVPEPATWLMLIAGVGGVGVTLRLRRRRTADSRKGNSGPGGKALAGATLWSTSAAVEAGDMATTVAAKSMMASVAGKAMLCVCPAAVVAGSVMTVPPLRHAVNAATAIPAAPAAPVVAAPALPCVEPATVPVSSAAVDGFPDAVSTVVSPSRSGTVAASPTIS